MMKMLPTHTTRRAPEFNGKALSLKRYWEDVKEVAESCEKTTDAEKIKVAFRYIDREDELLWNGSIAAGQVVTWTKFKTKIQELYPGSDSHKIFTTDNLDVYVTGRALKTIKTKDNFSEYHRKFSTIANHLITEGKMMDLEARKEFPKGLDEDFRGHVYRHLQITKPEHASDIPHNIADVVKVGQYILEGPKMGGETADTSFIKGEMVDLSDVFAKMNQRYHVDMQSLTQALNRNIPPPPRQAYPMYTAVQERHFPDVFDMMSANRCPSVAQM
jgi:hypothetical protein